MAGERRRRGGEGARERPRERGVRRDREQQRGTGRGRAAVAVAAAAALALGLAAAAAEWKRWSAAARLVTPHPAPPALLPGSTGPLASPQRFWGTYRPHVYFGMKTRSPRALVTGKGQGAGGGQAEPRGSRPENRGSPPPLVPLPVSPGLMWLQQGEGGGGLRHTCEQSGGPSRYGWVMHDGESFGVQEIKDGGLLLKTEFVKRPGGEHGGDWSWRITARMEVRCWVGDTHTSVRGWSGCFPHPSPRLFFLHRAQAARSPSSPSSSTSPRMSRGHCGRSWRTGRGWPP